MMGRLIDAERAKLMLSELLEVAKKENFTAEDAISHAFEWVESLQTAYDLEKVVAELKKESDFFSGKPMGTLQKAYYCKGIERAIEIVRMGGAEYKGGWIPCEVRLPEKNDIVLCWAKSTARGGDTCFVGSYHNGFWFLQSSADTHSFPGQYVIVAWKPIEPYQKEGE